MEGAKLEELTSSWVVEKLGRITQISRVMAKQYNEGVEKLGILNRYL